MSDRDIERVLRRALGAEPAADATVPTWLLDDTLTALDLCEREPSHAELDTPDDLALPVDVRGAALLADYTFRLDRRDGTAVVIEIDVISDGALVLEGRISPPATGTVEMIGRTLRATSPLDEFGRFDFDVVPRGTVRFAVQLPDERVVTDWVVVQPRSL
jgi:hypothetical protein